MRAASDEEKETQSEMTPATNNGRPLLGLRQRWGALRQRFASRRPTLQSLASITVFELANNLTPLITFPYLARVIGVEGFGVIGFGAALSSYASLVIAWGFNLTGTQAVAQARDNLPAVRRIVWDIVLARLCLAAVAASGLIAVTMLFLHDPTLRVVLFVFAASGLFEAFKVDWALRGMERLGQFASAAIISRLAYIPLMLLLVRTADDVVWTAVAMLGETAIFVGVAWAMAYRLGIIGWPNWSARRALAQVRGGFQVFLSEAAVPVYNSSGLALLGGLSTTYQTGLFSGAQKIRNAFQRALSPLTMVFYPRINYLAVDDPARMRSTIFKVLRLQAALGFCLSAIMFVAADPLVRLLLGPAFEDAVPVARIAASVIFFLALSTSCGQLVMLPLGMKREYALSISAGATCAALLMAPFAYFWGATGAALALVISECAVACSAIALLIYHVPWFRAGVMPTFAAPGIQSKQGSEM